MDLLDPKLIGYALGAAFTFVAVCFFYIWYTERPRNED